jgi:dTDP-glucose 4,6-dehydratase
VRHVADRPGHDRRYALDCAKIRGLGWEPRLPFETTLDETVDWYRAHRSWWGPIKSGDYLDYYRRQYAGRPAASITTPAAERPRPPAPRRSAPA